MRCTSLAYHVQLAGPQTESVDTDTRCRLHFNGRELCGENIRMLESLFLYHSNADKTKKNALDFFPMKSCAFFPLYPQI